MEADDIFSTSLTTNAATGSVPLRISRPSNSQVKFGFPPVVIPLRVNWYCAVKLMKFIGRSFAMLKAASVIGPVHVK